MASVINTNIASLNAQNNLTKSQNSLQTSLQRLSSGMRINSAADDSAGLAISTRMTSQINGLNQAARNANDAISLAQTADGALASITDNLQRMRDLAVQSSNATNTSVDRASLNTEFQQLSAEINRVANQTSFNGTKLIDGSFGGALFQVGANAGENISVASIVNAQTTALGGSYTRGTASIAASSLSGFATAVASGGVTVQGATGGAVNIGALSAAGSSAERAGQLANAINQVSQQTGVSANYDSATGQLTLTGASVTIAGTTNDATVAGFANGAVTMTSTTTTGVGALDVLGYGTAQSSIGMLDTALATVNSSRATLGAVQNRFQSAVANLNTAATNVSAARSRIQDTDFAAETANMTRAQILQQAGTAMLAQANALPNQVLSLLKG